MGGELFFSFDFRIEREWNFGWTQQKQINNFAREMCLPYISISINTQQWAHNSTLAKLFSRRVEMKENMKLLIENVWKRDFNAW